MNLKEVLLTIKEKEENHNIVQKEEPKHIKKTERNIEDQEK